MKTLLFLATLLAFESAFALELCTLDGVEVNLNHGDSTRGKSGYVVCKDKDSGKLRREYEITNGESAGKVVQIDWDGNREEYKRDKNNRILGVKKVTSPEGVLRSEESYVEGEMHGIQKRYTKTGKLEEIMFYEKGKELMRVQYTHSGALYALHCGKKGYDEIDKKLCGFDGKPSNVTLVELGKKEREVEYLKGEKKKVTRYDRKEVKMSEWVDRGDGKSVEKLFFENGEVKTEKNFVDDQIKNEKTFFMNGNVRNEATYKVVDKKTIKSAKSYFDTGTFEREGDFKIVSSRWGTRDEPVGPHKWYYANGKVSREIMYDDESREQGAVKSYFEKGTLYSDEVYEKGVRTKGKFFDENGKLLENKMFYPDGSSKDLGLDP